MRQRSTTRSPQHRAGQSRSGFRRAGITVAGLVSLALLAGACGSSSPSASQATTPTTAAGTSNAGTGVVTRPSSGSGSGSGSGSQSGNRSTGSYSVVFAECMRAHGVTKFPNPNGSRSQLGPDSGVNPASAAFQAALNGPCKSLAPAGWVSSGPVTK